MTTDYEKEKAKAARDAQTAAVDASRAILAERLGFAPGNCIKHYRIQKRMYTKKCPNLALCTRLPVDADVLCERSDEEVGLTFAPQPDDEPHLRETHEPLRLEQPMYLTDADGVAMGFPSKVEEYRDRRRALRATGTGG